ncbi:hypothetical protein [Halobacteriovorax sp. JY17]|uniref:hypothetical protein n=1 Tax=Halobacteriovorax sp. JY17 TaxID=2014617 RepID=UPI000C4DD87E|nr:hypothetical protein [Halobacteriovorax sp. JY17]PIK14830.1 MAG: hypothetical protein CES88_10870 [Halobacteriovorax sp. JY17]
MFKRLFALTVILICGLSFANSNDLQLMPSLEWQKQNLEENIHSKIDRILKSVIKKDQYNIDVEVLTKSQSEPQFYDSQKKNKPLGGLSRSGDITKSEAIEKKKEEENPELEKVTSKAQIKFDDVNPAEESEDIVTFSKFGIQAPLVDDFKDFQPDGKIVLTMQSSDDGSRIKKLKEEFQRKEDDFKHKLREIQSANNISPVEQMWKYNNSVDVFKNLKAVNITIRLSTALSLEVKQAVKNYVNSIRFNLGKVIPVIKFENALLGADTNIPTREDKIKEILNYFGKFSTLIGVLVGMILLGFIGKSLINKFFELSAAQSNAQTVKLEGQQDHNKDDDDSSEPGAPVIGGEAGGAGDLTGEYCGVERFKSYSKTSAKDAALLVKGWLQLNTKQSQSALRALVQQLENVDLSEVFSMLTDRERNEWKDLLNKPLSTAELASANKYISNEVVQRIIIPNVITDPETYDLIIRIRPEQVSELIEKKPEISSVLLNVLNTTFLNKVLSHCDEEKRGKIVDSAFEVREQDIINSQDKLKEVLQEYVQTFDKIPFIDKVITILPDASLDIELSLYEKLHKNTSVKRIKEVGMLSFPSFLIERFDEKNLKAILSEYDLEKKVKMLLTADEDIKKKFMDIYAPSGSKANDLLSLEFENYEKDERELEKLMNDKDAHWKSFVDYVRKRIVKDKELLNAAEEAIDTWTHSLGGDSSYDNVEELKVA